KQTSGKFHVLVVKLNGALLEFGLRPGFISTGRPSGHSNHKRDGRYRGSQHRYVIDVLHTWQFDGAALLLDRKFFSEPRLLKETFDKRVNGPVNEPNETSYWYRIAQFPYASFTLAPLSRHLRRSGFH